MNETVNCATCEALVYKTDVPSKKTGNCWKCEIQQMKEAYGGKIQPSTQLGTWTILPATRSEVDTSLAEAQGLLQALENFQAKSPQEQEQLAEIMNEAHARAKNLDSLRLQVAKPAHEAKKTVDEFFRPAIRAWNEAKTKSKTLINEALRAQEQLRQEQLAQQAQEPLHWTGHMVDQPTQPIAALAPAAPLPGVALRQEVKIVIEDESQIPLEYWCIDWSALKIAAREGRSVPGVKFVHQQSAMVKRK